MLHRCWKLSKAFWIKPEFWRSTTMLCFIKFMYLLLYWYRWLVNTMVGDLSTIFVLYLISIFLTYCKCEDSLNCGAIVKSTCKDDITTKWNRNDVSKGLKTWMNGIVMLTSMKEGEQKHFNLRKTVKQESNIVRYIGNVNCTLKTSFGPTWRTAGEISKDQFHDGFLYGVEDENGTLTGLLLIIVVYQNVISIFC